MGRKKKYLTEEERKEAKRLRNAEYYKHNKDKIYEKQIEWRTNNKEKLAEYYSEYHHKYWAEYYKNNKEKFDEKQTEYQKTPIGRANNLSSSYKHNDKINGKGECTLTGQWIVDNIFTKKCVYCGESDWRKLGCDRIDNTLPHTPDNVVPCCAECNTKRGTIPYYEYLKKMATEK